MNYLIYFLAGLLMLNINFLHGEEVEEKSGLATRDIACLSVIVIAPTLAILWSIWSQSNKMNKLNSNVDELKATLAAFITLNDTPGGSGDSSPHKDSKDEEGTESPKVLPRSVSFIRLDGIEAKLDSLTKNLPDILTQAIVRARIVPEYTGNPGSPAPLNGQSLNPPIAIKTVSPGTKQPDSKDNNGRK